MGDVSCEAPAEHATGGVGPDGDRVTGEKESQGGARAGGSPLRPAWLELSPDQWPEDAREFYRLCFFILKRAQTQGEQLSGKD